MRTHVETLPVNEYVAQDGARSFLIKRENSRRWSLWCKIRSANLALASSPLERLTFEGPEQCVALFRDQSGFEHEWADFIDRIHAHERADTPQPLDAALADTKMWIGAVESPV
jgi:hypothetical protein